MNFMIEKIWRSIDQDFFTAIQSMIEDNIQSVAPSFVVSRIFDVNEIRGTNNRKLKPIERYIHL